MPEAEESAFGYEAYSRNQISPNDQTLLGIQVDTRHIITTITYLIKPPRIQQE